MKAAAIVCAAAVVIAALAVGASAGMADLVASSGHAPASAEAAEIPPKLRQVYREASERCPGLPWQLLAAIGWHESHHGGAGFDDETGWPKNDIVGPALDGRPGFAAISDAASADGWAHALGPMQFLPATWRRWAVLAPRRTPRHPGEEVRADPQNAWDAAHTAARYLCGGRDAIGDLHAAVLSYNRSESYFDAVWSKAIAYGMAPDGSSGRGLPSAPTRGATGTMAVGDPRVVVSAALRQVGVPYVWGGVTAGVGLDCSGLVVVAFRVAGVELPRTTSAQVHVGGHVDPGSLRPADLLFFRGGRPTHDKGHVGIYIGDDRMVVAPRSGETVRVETVRRSSIQEARRVLLG